MNLKPLVLAGCLVLAASWLASPADARQAGPQGGRQQGQRPGLRAGAGGAPVVTPGELERWLDSYVLLQAQDTLRLTDAQFPRFVQRLKVLQEGRRRHLQERRQLLSSLGALAKATPFDEAAARERLKALRDLDARSAEELQKARDAVDEVLDVQQQARFRLFEEAVERRKIDLLMRARQRAGEWAPGAPSAVK
jgi:Spy/CpxP family protein refolding chaperone